MTIIRVQHDKNAPYVVISKNTLSDRSVSFEARGFLAFLLGKPDDWSIRPLELAKESRVSRATIYRLLRQLIEAGYVEREDFKRRTVDGRFEQGSIYHIFEEKHERGPLSIEDDGEVLLNGEKIPF